MKLSEKHLAGKSSDRRRLFDPVAVTASHFANSFARALRRRAMFAKGKLAVLGVAEDRPHPYCSLTLPALGIAEGMQLLANVPT